VTARVGFESLFTFWTGSWACCRCV